MHEYHIVEEIVKNARETAQNNNAKKVTKISLVLGELSGLEETSIRLYFENLSKGTNLEEAELLIRSIPAKLKCRECDIEFDYKAAEFTCPKCNKLGTRTDIGKELYIDTIEIES